MQTATPDHAPSRTPRRRWLFVAVPLALLLTGAFLLFRPDKLFVDDRVDEALGEAFTPSTGVPATSPPSTGGATAASTAGATAASTAAAGTAAPASTATSAAPAPAEPLLTWQGQFESLAHEGTGTVSVYEQDGQVVLRFEDDTAVENGPDLNVYLLPTQSWTGSVDGFVDLGDLKGNVGGQNYTVPAGTDLATYRTVVVWCVRFSVGFAAASLMPV